ncbi:hypothetical protein DH2020_002460 [Rehmannia glutinosa]|uniref:Uncharacterized protein n=1 Tax=Rehmannia glutinosa TaxID=99300 RepID=A0ABR0XTV4_REHGL
MCYDRFVMAFLNSTLSETFVHQANAYNTARNLWFTLEETFLQQSLARQSLLHAQLRTLKKEALFVPDYLQQLSTLSAALATIGEIIYDHDLVIHALDGLPREYHPFVTSIENLSPTPTFSQLRAKLLTYEQRLLLDNDPQLSTDNSSVHAITIQFSNALTHSATNTNNVRFPGSSPHPNNFSKPSNNLNKIKCQICAQPGHSAAHCKYRDAQSRNNNP